MKKLQFYRNTTIYIPTQGSTAIENAKAAISQLDEVSDGEIVLARYQENQADGTKTLVCVRHDNNNDTGWTFLEESNDGDYYTKEEIDDTEEVIAQALSELDERLGNEVSAREQLTQDVIDTNQAIEENELITARALNELANRIDESGTVTGIKMNNAIKGTEGIVDLGTVLTEHQSLSDYYTKSEIDAKNLDKVPYTSVSQVSSTITIEPYKMYDFGTLTDSHTLVFDTTKEVAGYVKEYMFRFVAGASCSVTLPNGVLYANGTTPIYVSGHTYEIDVINNCAAVVEFY